MNDQIISKYRSNRRKYPTMPAKHCLQWAKRPDASAQWEEDGDERWTCEVDGLTIKLRVESESIFPEPDKHGNTDYGNYVDEVRGEDYDWEGNWPRPSEDAPLGLPYTTIRYSGPGWVQGDMSGGYFIPEGIEDMYRSFRHSQSKSVAWDMTKQWVEDQLTMLFCSPLTNVAVHIEAWSEDIELASTCMGTDVSGDTEGRDYIFEMVKEHDMIDEVVTEAKAEIKRLAALEA